jgi:CRISPR-associated endonuclease/helicase Cas3
MHTEVSPISSFLQRAGRCARFGGEKGKIFIYDLLKLPEQELVSVESISLEDKAEVNRINNKYLPYEQSLCLITLKELQKIQTLDDPTPKQLIERILGSEEKLFIEKMERGQGGGFNQDRIRESWIACQKNHYRSTIRDIQSVEITLITDLMCNEVSKYPYRYQSLGMFKWSLVGWLNKIVEGEGPVPFDDDDWLIKRVEENNLFGEFENDEDVIFKLSKITNFQEVPANVFLNAKYFGYHDKFGLNWRYDYSFNNASPQRQEKVQNEAFKVLTKDTFYEHNMGLIGALKKEFLSEREDKLDFVFKELVKFFDVSAMKKNHFIDLITLMIALHDYGKLNDKWQKPMQYYQAIKQKSSVAQFREILAHTDYNSNDTGDIELGRKANLIKRPAHAGVGAYIVEGIENDMFFCEYFKSAISMAIARHHSPLSNSYPDFNISEENHNAIKELFTYLNIEIGLERKDFKGKLSGFESDWHGEYIAYLFFVRILRVCDQKATQNLKHYYKATEHV